MNSITKREVDTAVFLDDLHAKGDATAFISGKNYYDSVPEVEGCKSLNIKNIEGKTSKRVIRNVRKEYVPCQ